MDEDHRQIIEKIRNKYQNSGNRDIKDLLTIISSLEIKLIGADVMAMMVDIAVRRKVLDERGGIADARLNYGMSWQYEFADKKLLLEYKGGIEEVKERLSQKPI